MLRLTAGDVPRHWFADSVLATHVANGVNLLFPAGERFFVRSVNHFLERVTDPTLRAEVRGFFGQEGRHAQAHENDVERLRAQGFRIDGFLRLYQLVAFRLVERACSPELRLAATAAAEHFTAILAHGALTRGALERAHPEMQRLLLWHAAEEIEHKHVAFAVLQLVAPGYRLRVAGMALAAANLALWWAIGTTVLLAQDGAGWRRILAELRHGPDEAPLLRRVFVRGIRDYLRRDFDPRQVDDYALARQYLEAAGLEPAGTTEAA